MTVTYLRVSTDEQDLAPQRLQLTQHCAAKGWPIAREFTDVISGAKSKRPGLTALLADCKAGLVARIVTTKIDRLGRSMSDFIALSDRLGAMGVALVCCQQNIDTGAETPEGEMMRHMLAVFAQFERRLISGRTKDGLAVARANGVRLGRPSPRLVANWREVVEAWKYTGAGYGKLAKQLGGVSKCTAWTLVNKPKPVAPSAPATSTLAAEF